MSKKLTGRDIDVMVGSLMVHVQEVSLSIEDGTTTTTTRGVPDGYIEGAVSASGELKLATGAFGTLMDAARSSGSFRGLEPFDLVFNAETTGEKLNIEAFECKLKISDLLSANQSGDERLTHTVTYEVTGREFVRINGVPLLRPEEISRLNT